MDTFDAQGVEADTQLLAFLTINWVSGKVQETVQVANAWDRMSVQRGCCAYLYGSCQELPDGVFA